LRVSLWAVLCPFIPHSLERLPFKFYLKEISMFPRWKNFPRSGVLVLTRLVLTLVFVLAIQHRAEANSSDGPVGRFRVSD
jgi:hypothetical protein